MLLSSRTNTVIFHEYKFFDALLRVIFGEHSKLKILHAWASSQKIRFAGGETVQEEEYAIEIRDPLGDGMPMPPARRSAKPKTYDWLP